MISVMFFNLTKECAFSGHNNLDSNSSGNTEKETDKRISFFDNVFIGGFSEIYMELTEVSLKT